MQKRLALLATLSLVACGNNKIPLPTGLTLKLNTTSTKTVTSFHKRGTAAPVEQSSGFNTAENCTIVQQPRTTNTTVTNSAAVDTWEVLGQTNASHPLVPNADTFSPTQVSIVKGLRSETGESVSTTVTFTPGATQERVTTTQTSALNVEGNATYFGIAVDEYYVLLASLTGLWAELDQNPTQNPEPKAGVGNEQDGVPGEAERFPSILLTRYEPKKGDIWSSTTGESLYFADGTEELTISGKKVTTNRIKIYSVRGIDPTASDVLATCVVELKRDFTTNQTGADNSSAPLAFLIPSCTSSFVHALEGTEWWYKGALVKASRTKTTVNVAQGEGVGFGYEFTQADTPIVGQCSRGVSPTRPQSPTTSELFVQYTVTTETSESIATELKEATQQ